MLTNCMIYTTSRYAFVFDNFSASTTNRVVAVNINMKKTSMGPELILAKCVIFRLNSHPFLSQLMPAIKL